uniref:U21-Liphistoxin-Lm1c_1 n=1 Tax=Liphistius malayanus TaxID=1203467 RepID=A0A482ZAJ6_9ARAC
MDRIKGICFILILIVVSSSAFTCPECDLRRCTPLDPATCPLGVTKDPCNCCPVCYKTEGEVCGGPWNTSGKCGEHLFCAQLTSTTSDYYGFNPDGICRKMTPE